MPYSLAWGREVPSYHVCPWGGTEGVLAVERQVIREEEAYALCSYFHPIRASRGYSVK